MSAVANYNPYDAFLLGEAYNEAGWIIRSRFQGDIPLDFKYVIAANLAIGLELYFKCLIVMSGKSPAEIHNLKSLFDALSQDNQKAIRDGYAEILKGDRYRMEFEKLRQSGENPEKTFRFDRVLSECALAFEKSRYPFDPKFKTHEYLAVPINEATRKVIVELQPHWDGAFWSLANRPAKRPTSPAP